MPPQPPPESLHPETVAIRAGRPHDPGEPLNHPLVATSTYRLGGDRSYARGEGTSTVAAFESAIGALEGGFAVSFGSGMAAIAAIVDDLPVGASIVAPDDCYQGVTMTLQRGVERFGWTVETIDLADTGRWLAAVADRPDLVWLESPSNPLLTVADVGAICGAAASSGVPVAVDNTFATPLLQRPLALGATWSVHSVTKFIGGHSDLLGGVAVTADADRRDALVRRQSLGGASPGALESFLALRGLRTLPVRLERAQATATELARRLVEHRAVTRVRYPGLATDPGHALAARTLDGPGAIVSFETAGDGAAVDRALDQLAVITPATSLGGVETTAERRARIEGQTHLPATLVRLSVGCEHVDDLWADLASALDRLPAGD